MLTGAGQTTTNTPLLSHEVGSDCRPPDEHERTAYQYGETDDNASAKTQASSAASSRASSPALDRSDAGDTRAADMEDYLLYGDLSADSASQSSHASSAADSAPLDNHHEEYIDWLCAGCPASDTEYISEPACDSSNASCAPLDHSAEDYNDWNQEGCPDGPYQFDADSDPDSESNWMS